MITYEEALKKAKSLKRVVNYCMEYTDAYVFSDKGEMTIGGEGPVVIIKRTGDAINMVAYIDEYRGGRLLREFSIKGNSSGEESSSKKK